MADGTRWIWIGGDAAPVAPEAARISALDHGYLYGSGLYETLRTYRGRPFALAEHLERLRRGAQRVASPGEWPWSSFSATAGRDAVPSRLTVRRVLSRYVR